MKNIYKNLTTAIIVLATINSYGQIKIELDTPSTYATIYAPNLISTNHKERDMAISPDGTEIYYTVFVNGLDGNIYYTKKEDETWSLPAIVEFSGKGNDLEPVFAFGGNRLYFSSKRRSTSYDIWYVERENGGKWSEPITVGSPINTSENEFYPSVVNDGSLYYTANYDGGEGGEDIWYSQLVEGVYQIPVPVENVSTNFDEFNAFIDPEEQYIYFGSYGRADGMGGGDIYLSTKLEDGSWSKGENLGGEINSADLDYCPFVSPDGKFLFFTSTRRVQAANKSQNPFDINAVANSFMSPDGNGSNIFWIKR